MNQPIYFRADTTINKINEEYITCPCLKKLLKNYPEYGTFENPYPLDIDKKSLEHLVEFLRNGEMYNIPEHEKTIIDLMEADNVDIPNNFIQLNVGNNIFHTTRRTLSKLSYFEAFLRWKQQIPTYIDRNGKAFRHILYCARCPSYQIPSKYHYENNFFGLSIPNTKQYQPLKQVKFLPSELFGITNQHAQNEYLTGNPQITFFKKIYRRHTNFSIGIGMTNGAQNDDTIYFSLAQLNVDLLSEMFIIIGSPNHKIDLSDIINIKFYVNNEIIEYNSSKIINMYMKLFDPKSNNMYLEYIEKNQLYIPLYFAFNDPGCALPYIDDIHIILTLKRADTKVESQLFYQYILLDKEEQNRFEQVSHEYLYLRLADYSITVDNKNMTIDLPFNANIKWIVIEINPLDDTKNIQSELLNYAKVFHCKKLITMTTHIVSRRAIDCACNVDIKERPKNFYFIPFCLNALVHQPSGTLSIVDGLSIELDLNCKNAEVTFYEMYYNVLRIIGLTNHCDYSYAYNIYQYPKDVECIR